MDSRVGARVRGRLVAALAAAVLAVVAVLPSTAHATGSAGTERPRSEPSTGRADRTAVAARHFIVATANPLATAAGYEILKAGGTAADAAIAVQLVLGLVEPQSSGLGGGAFLLYHDATTGRAVAFDARETAPLAATPARFLDASGRPLTFYDAVVGGRSVGVPGTVRLLEAVHRRYGRLPWPRLFRRAIALAENGFAVSPRLHGLIATETHFMQARARDYFLAPDRSARPVGFVLTNPAYAKTLRALERGGAAAFYSGAIAADVLDTADHAPRHPGDLTLRDLSRYRVVVREPVCDAYHGYRVCGMPPPSSGGIAVLQILKMLEPYDLASMGVETFWSVHFISEAERLAFADRDAWIADPAFEPTPPGLLDARYLRERSRLIRTTGSLGHALPGDPRHRRALPTEIAVASAGADELPSTSQIVIVDRYGNAVTMTTTIEAAFGSRLMTRGGFLLNNELTDFSFVPEKDGKPVANRVEPGKRPRSSMAPTLVYDRRGRLDALAGSAGGSLIINDVTKALIAMLDWGLDPQAAAALPNFGSRNGPTELERDTAVVRLGPRLHALGHEVRLIDDPSGLQALRRVSSGWIGGADPRREGTVQGD